MAMLADFSELRQFTEKDTLFEAEQRVGGARRQLLQKTGAGSEYLGWLDVGTLTPPNLLAELQSCAAQLRSDSDVILVLGIGGSYLGARAAIEWLCTPSYNQLSRPEIYFAGNELSPAHIHGLMNICEGKRVSLIVISKSGTTTETAVAFRILRDYMKRRYGCQYKKRIVAITDRSSGLLRSLATREDYRCFDIPTDVGGRYSVLSPVGLLPIACASIDIAQLLAGAAAAQREFHTKPFSENKAMQYAALRWALYQQGYRVELFCGWDSAMQLTLEWLKQLFGESEGKEGKGLFPASACYSTDLHSLGQFVQEGTPILFETFLSFAEEQADMEIPYDSADSDGLNYLCGKTLGQINRVAKDAVAEAHRQGKVPVGQLLLSRQDAFSYGYLLYFFQFSCALGGYALGVNPFDQPGVEQYKRHMFQMLGKPGFEK